jgi:hypothetical protein
LEQPCTEILLSLSIALERCQVEPAHPKERKREMRVRRALIIPALLGVCVFAGCSDSQQQVGPGEAMDAAAEDAGPLDAGAPDAGTDAAVVASILFFADTLPYPTMPEQEPGNGYAPADDPDVTTYSYNGGAFPLFNNHADEHHGVNIVGTDWTEAQLYEGTANIGVHIQGPPAKDVGSVEFEASPLQYADMEYYSQYFSPLLWKYALGSSGEEGAYHVDLITLDWGPTSEPGRYRIFVFNGLANESISGRMVAVDYDMEQGFTYNPDVFEASIVSTLAAGHWASIEAQHPIWTDPNDPPTLTMPDFWSDARADLHLPAQLAQNVLVPRGGAGPMDEEISATPYAEYPFTPFPDQGVFFIHVFPFANAATGGLAVSSFTLAFSCRDSLFREHMMPCQTYSSSP